jgi:isopentenyl-diphosphate delta-isomerase
VSETRKNDHIDLTFQSSPTEKIKTYKLSYEPLFSAHPNNLGEARTFNILNHQLKLPLWVSSMTGGAERALGINTNLARACGDFGFGMGLGSCRVLLEDKSRLKDFDVKHLMPDMPLYSNFGIAQLEELIDNKHLYKLDEINASLRVDGMVIHVNPLQEWAQPEGDQYKRPAIDTIKTLCEEMSLPLIVKEVGQGFGPKSLDALLRLPLQAIETAGFGGTNFTNIELARLYGSKSGKYSPKTEMGLIGNSCDEMIEWLNSFDLNIAVCREIIISGGISNVTEGYALTQSCQFDSIFGMASNLLRHSMGEYSELKDYLDEVKSVIGICEAYLK